MSDLATFLRASGGRPFAWGVQDCCLWAADWVCLATGRDPAAGWRGRYHTAIGAARLLTRRGGFEAHVAACLADVGLTGSADPRPGDVGIVPGLNGPTFAILTQAGWAAKDVMGIVVAKCSFERAWSLPCPSR